MENRTCKIGNSGVIPKSECAGIPLSSGLPEYLRQDV